MSLDPRTMKDMICPRCGCYKRMGGKGTSFPNCRVCGTKFIETDIFLIEHAHLKGQELEKLNKRLREQFVRTSPVYDPEMEEIRKAIERGEPVPPRLVKCPVCEGKTSSSASNCPHCGQAISELMEFEQNTSVSTLARHVPDVPRCPMCNSDLIERIGSFDRVTSVMFWGLASSKIGKQYKCRNCRHKW